MKDKKLPKGVVENPLVPSQESFMPNKPTRLNDDKCKESIAKQFAYNRGSFSGPLNADEFDDPAEELLDMEEKAEGCNYSDE